ncbi:MAG: DUF3987 domain-containing protein [Verrucomicrobia bacterium]|nr:DUF3987 domain-containing protein [Verrucomicrobiota bacterium]
MLDKVALTKIQNHVSGYVWHWIYEEHGRPIMVVARYDTKDGKTYRQFAYEDGEWKEGVPSTPYPLFGLESLRNESPLKSLLICEGEKCTSLPHQLKWSAISTTMGAQNTAHADFTPLRHFDQFIILRDNDEAGANYARDIATFIRKMKPEANIQVCNLMPDMPGGDIIDWVLQKPLCGFSWDGYAKLSDEHLTRVSEGLQAAIKQCSIPIEDCKIVNFKGELALFDGDPRPIANTLCPVPPFPIHLLSECLVQYLKLCAKQMCIPIDFSATSFLALIGGIIGRPIRLEMRPGQRWEEVANIWAVMVGPPASKKSPTLRRMCRPISALESLAEKKFSETMKVYKLDKKQAQEKDEDFDTPEPTLRRYISDDCTTPKLRELLSKNTRGLILRSDELKGQLEKLDKEGHEGDRSFMMQCWSGLDFYNEDRLNRGSSVRIPLTITWISGIQPTCLAHYLRQAILGGNNADGFMQRFQMVVFPDLEKTYQICQEPMSDDLENKIENLFITIDEQTQDVERCLRFSAEAQQYFDHWHITLENECRSGAHPPYWESHIGKEPKLLAALCIILHVLQEVIENISSDEISLSTLKAAEELALYYRKHAHRCYESIQSVEFSDAIKILGFVRQKKISPRFKPADIYHNNLGGIKEKNRVASALSLLQDFGCVAQEKIYGANGRPSEYWIIHPKLRNKE